MYYLNKVTITSELIRVFSTWSNDRFFFHQFPLWNSISKVQILVAQLFQTIDVEIAIERGNALRNFAERSLGRSRLGSFKHIEIQELVLRVWFIHRYRKVRHCVKFGRQWVGVVMIWYAGGVHFMWSDRAHSVLVLHHTLLLVKLVHQSPYAVGYCADVLIPIFKYI